MATNSTQRQKQVNKIRNFTSKSTINIFIDVIFSFRGHINRLFIFLQIGKREKCYLASILFICYPFFPSFYADTDDAEPEFVNF